MCLVAFPASPENGPFVSRIAAEFLYGPPWTSGDVSKRAQSASFDGGELLNEFDIRGNAALSAVIRKQKDILARSAKVDLEHETAWDREWNETFELDASSRPPSLPDG